MILAFLILFLLHNFLTHPLLARGKKVWVYVAVTLVLLGAFVAFVLLGHTGPGPEMPPPGPRSAACRIARWWTNAGILPKTCT